VAVKRSKEIEEARNRLPITGEEQLIMETINNHQAYALSVILLPALFLFLCSSMNSKDRFIVLWIRIWFGFRIRKSLIMRPDSETLKNRPVFTHFTDTIYRC
jgi:hypothetical protein